MIISEQKRFLNIKKKGTMKMTKLKFSFDNVSDLTNPNELREARFMDGSKNAIYNLFHQEGFPLIKIGKRMYVSKEALKTWLEQQAQVN